MTVMEELGMAHALSVDGKCGEPRIAVLLPCYNEAAAIGPVVADFRRALPGAKIYVYDNNSIDGTAQVAADAGAIVRRETRQGKGNVVRRMFADIDADIYVMADGDGTYEAAAAPRLIERLQRDCLDLVTGCRVSDATGAYRLGHRFGNKMLTGVVASIFGRNTCDMLSGYRVFSRRFVKSFPALSRGFETETELTVHALELRMPIADENTAYGERCEGSESKLSTLRDGARISWMILGLLKEERPMELFGLIGLALGLLSLALGIPVVFEYMKTGLVDRFPTAILCSALMTVAVISVFAGLILDSITHARSELRRLAYLRLPPPPGLPE